jgi:multidrug efflux pump subunit AcrA (membrane-fusion protein)
VNALTPSASESSVGDFGTIEMPLAQQRAIQLKTARAVMGATSEEVEAPGRIAADQEHFAFITPRAPGVVRTVLVNIGQDVQAGDVLATVDSPDVGRTRLELRTQRQLLEVAEAQARRQEEVYANTLELIAGLKRGDEPDQIQKDMEGRPVGAGRERIMTAYAQFRMASASMERHTNLVESKAIAMSQFQQVRATYEAAAATYQALLDSTAYDARLAHLQAQQAKAQANTSVDVAQDRLKILGVGPEGVASPTQTEGIDTPLSTYTLVAPFDGTILDRELIVPGVSVDVADHLFTIADLSHVWLEVNVSEGDFETLARAQGGEIRFDSPAYPGHTFKASVIYRGDLVDEASRSVKLLAAAENPDRLLKPGMYIDANLRCPGEREAVNVPDSAVVTEGVGTFVFVKLGPERFERRAVQVQPPSEGRVAILHGLESGEEVVISGASKLKATAITSVELQAAALASEEGL